ncbi:hypothetical protein D1AOALGA4SA_4386 [Olavius algarvensis Delta 1 endosymbiont]|nr:hypothetical protein D1AOALGA4SA_4386 [Olavius algarvensis Delta 1 endosymbiont]
MFHYKILCQFRHPRWGVFSHPLPENFKRHVYARILADINI